MHACMCAVGLEWCFKKTRFPPQRCPSFGRAVSRRREQLQSMRPLSEGRYTTSAVCEAPPTSCWRRSGQHHPPRDSHSCLHSVRHPQAARPLFLHAKDLSLNLKQTPMGLYIGHDPIRSSYPLPADALHPPEKPQAESRKTTYALRLLLEQWWSL